MINEPMPIITSEPAIMIWPSVLVNRIDMYDGFSAKMARPIRNGMAIST